MKVGINFLLFIATSSMLVGCTKSYDLDVSKLSKPIFFSNSFANDLEPIADGGYQVSSSWLPLNMPSLTVMPGSPLDLSSVFPAQKIAGKIGISADGHFKNDTGRIKFLCASASFTPPYGGYPTHDEAIQYAQQYRMAGYNLVRLHFTDAILMTGRTTDFDYNPEQLDRFHFFLNELRKQGIYWYIDGMTSWNGAKGNVEPDRWVGKYALKRTVHYDLSARQHWLNLIKTLYGRINPYTGKSILADDALAGIVLVNEGGLHFASMQLGKIPDDIKPTLNQWLYKKYATRSDFPAIWGQPFNAIMDGTLDYPNPTKSDDRLKDVLEYFSVVEIETSQWMADQIKSLGYLGPVSNYNNGISLQASKSRNVLPWIDLHAYYDEPTNFVTAGSRIKNTSSFDDSLSYYQVLAQNKIAGKPFTVTEYGQPFWSSWRREAGLVIPAFAAFQDWDAICQHAESPNELNYARTDGWHNAMRPYAIGYDPVTRVGEMLGAFLFRRGDLATEDSVIRFVASPSLANSYFWTWGLNQNYGLIALFNKVESSSSLSNSANVLNLNITAPNKFQIVGAKFGPIRSLMSDDVSSQLPSSFLIGSDVKAKIFTTNNNQIIIDANKKTMRVNTPKTQGALLVEPSSVDITPAIKNIKTNQAGLFVVSSLDGKNLVDSNRVLLMLGLDALNSGMKFEDEKRTILKELGQFPLLIPPLSMSMSFDFGSFKTASAELLSTTGDKITTLPVRIEGGLLVLDLNYSADNIGFYVNINLVR